MDYKLKAGLAVTALFAAASAVAQVTFYEGEGYRGQAFTTDRPIWNLERYGFNDRASSLIIDHGRWEICEDARFQGRCVVLTPGSYDSLRRMGMNNRVSSVRPIDGNRNYSDYREPEPSAPQYDDYRRRPDERVYEIPVTSVRAVVGPPEQRCWVEREQVGQTGSGNDSGVGGAVAGAIIGGILGHQVGGGSGRDVATAGGAVAGAAIGSNVGRNYGNSYPRDVRHCSNVPSGPPEYWDVTYDFRGVEHRIQMSAPPGRTILVNAQGEPRQ